MFKMTYVIKIADDDNFLEDYKRIYGNPYPISEKLIEIISIECNIEK